MRPGRRRPSNACSTRGAPPLPDTNLHDATRPDASSRHRLRLDAQRRSRAMTGHSWLRRTRPGKGRSRSQRAVRAGRFDLRIMPALLDWNEPHRPPRRPAQIPIPAPGRRLGSESRSAVAVNEFRADPVSRVPPGAARAGAAPRGSPICLRGRSAARVARPRRFPGGPGTAPDPSARCSIRAPR